MENSYTKYKRYDEDFKRNAVELAAASGRSMAEVAGELGIPYKTLERWKTLYAPRAGETAAAATSRGKSVDQLAAELEQATRKLAYVEREREILKKALAICSRDQVGKLNLN